MKLPNCQSRLRESQAGKFKTQSALGEAFGIGFSDRGSTPLASIHESALPENGRALSFILQYLFFSLHSSICLHFKNPGLRCVSQATIPFQTAFFNAEKLHRFMQLVNLRLTQKLALTH